MNHYFTLKNAQKMARATPNAFEAPALAELRGLVFPDTWVKVCGGINHFERFWIKVTEREGDNLFGKVDNHLIMQEAGIGVPVLGQVIALKMEHIYQLPILVAPTGMKVCEIQVCAMHNGVNGGVLADSNYKGGPLEVNGYDVLVRYCDIGDDPTEPEDILHFDDWEFKTADEAGVFANYLAKTYTPDFEPERI